MATAQKLKYVVKQTDEDGRVYKNLVLAVTAEEAEIICKNTYGYSPDETYPMELQ